MIEIVNNRENGYLIIQNSWFICAITVFYVFFYFTYKKRNGLQAIGCVFLLVNLYAVLCYMCGLGVWWYYSSWAFVAGLVWSTYKTGISELIKNHYYKCVLVMGAAFAASYFVRYVNKITIHLEFISLVACLIASLFFSITVILVGVVFDFSHPVLNFCGKVSMEIYLIHELVYLLLRSKWITIENEFLYVGITIIISVIAAYLLQKTIQYADKALKRIGNTRNH